MQKVLTNDGSYTLYSELFNQHYHSCRDGALNESLQKHVIPALTYHNTKKQLFILDICFGLGYNTLATLYYIKQNNLDIEVFIYSPEFDTDLLEMLGSFTYPKEFDRFKDIIIALSRTKHYKDQKCKITIYNADARIYLKKLLLDGIKFDIVYQDAFSSDVNKSLWTKEYFADIVKLLKKDAIITTYSVATNVRLSMWENGLNIYEIVSNNRKSTIALNKKEIDQNYKYIDMILKQQRNKVAKSLKDTQF